MKATIFTDLHFDHIMGYTRTGKKEDIIKRIAEKETDCVLLCGDNAEFDYDFFSHERTFEFFKEIFNCPIALVAGNHCLWGKGHYSSRDLLYNQYQQLATEFGLIYLENENLQIGDFTIVGTYGHYDYSLGKVGNGITKENFLTGRAIIGDKVHGWVDKSYMDWQGKTDEEITRELMENFINRISNKKGQLITLSHTLPNMDVVGHPLSKLQNFLGAYSGTLLLEEIIRENEPLYHFCGHTHAEATSKIGKTKVINIGSSFKNLKYALLDTAKNTVEIFQEALLDIK